MLRSSGQTRPGDVAPFPVSCRVQAGGFQNGSGVFCMVIALTASWKLALTAFFTSMAYPIATQVWL